MLDVVGSPVNNMNLLRQIGCPPQYCLHCSHSSVMSRAKPNSDESWAFYRRCTDKRVTVHVWYHVVSADIAGPTCLWSYWWHQWAHNNWSDSTKRSVTDCPLRGARVACDTEPVRERIHDPHLLTLYNLFDHQFDRDQCVFGSVCASHWMSWPDQLNRNPTSAGAFVYIFKLLNCFCFLEGM